MKDKFNFIPETEANMDDATYLRNLEDFSAAGNPEMEIKPNVFEVEIESADGTVKTWQFTSETIYNAKGGRLKRIVKAVISGGLSEKGVRKAVSTVSTLGLSQTKAGKKASAKVEKGIEKAEIKAEEIGKKAVQKFKTVSLALPRAAFASLAAINIFGIASHLNSIQDASKRGSVPHQKKWTEVRNFWYKIGGSRNKFDKLILNGSKRKPFLARVKKKVKPATATNKADGDYVEIEYLFAGDENYQEMMNVAGVDDAAIAAWIGIATSVIVAVKKIAGKPPQMDADTEGALDSEAAAEAAEFNALMQEEADNPTPEGLRDLSMIMPLWAWALVGIAGISLLGFIIYKITKKK